MLQEGDGRIKTSALDRRPTLRSFVLSLAAIVFSEVGDKTFLVAALMAMRHSRTAVFSAAFSALVSMTLLSAVLGHAVPTLISVGISHLLAAALFLVFGAKMFFEARTMSPDEGVSQEMKEVEMELDEKVVASRRLGRRGSVIDPYVLEAGIRKGGRRYSSPDSSSPSPDRAGPRRGLSATLVAGGANLFALLLSPAWAQTFAMTFLGEWGDRSQMATIAMAAGRDYWVVTWGAIAGHGLCTAVAVLGGRAVAGKVSMRIGECALFFFFLFFCSACLLTCGSHVWRSGGILYVRTGILDRGIVLIG